MGVEIIFIFFPTPARIWYGFKKVGASYEADTYSETMSLRTESFLVGLIGDGITSSLTPPMHEAEADAHGVRYLYRPVDLDALNLDGASAPALLDAAAILGFNAFNITHPCKQSVMEYLHELSDAARALGAVNCVVIGEDGSFYGDNTDYSGFIAGLKRGLPQVEHVVQLGAGGAGSATAYALCRLGVRRLSLFERDAAKAQELAEQLGGLFPQTRIEVLSDDERLIEALLEAQGLVNATPVGMHVHPGIPLSESALSAGVLREGLWVADVIYLPQQTQLVRAARAAGCEVLTGGYMAVGQAVDAFRLFTGLEPNAERMAAHFETLIAAQQGA